MLDRHSNSQQLMDQAIASLRLANVTFHKNTAHHLKVGIFNYYPSKGTIFCDGDLRARAEKGLPSFLNLLRKAGLARDSKAVEAVAAPNVTISHSETA